MKPPDTTLWLLTLTSIIMMTTFSHAAEKPTRILMIGNSYTAPLKKHIAAGLNASGHGDVEMAYITPGGARLANHAKKAATLKKIREGKWDIVVLQDQSQTPGLPGQWGESFHSGAKELCKEIKAAGATPMFYMTWGRRDGDKQNPQLYKDFESMQKRLSGAYRKAATDNTCTVVPVGEAWAIIRNDDDKLGKALYAKDGSHPSAKGAYLTSCMFLTEWLQADLETLPAPGNMTGKEKALIHKAVKAAK